MSVPEHQNPTYKNRVARAPYNFVPLPERVLTVEDPPPQDRYDPKLLTGKLSCTLTTASPLYVRAAQTWKEYTHKDKGEKPDPITPSDPFYGETKETLLIPGSSLRGMLRTMVEVISQSRLAPVTDKPLFFRTVDNTSIGQAYRKRMTGEIEDQGWYSTALAGYIELRGSDYFIRPVRTIMGGQHFKVEEEIARKAISSLRNMAFQKSNGRWSPERSYRGKPFEIWFKPNAPISHQPSSYTYFADVTEIYYGNTPPAGKAWVKGWLMASGWVPSMRGPGKHRHWIIGPPDPDDSKLILVNDDDIELYKEYGGLTKAKESFSVLPTNGKTVPCFYTLWEDQTGRERVAFGHTGMFRLPYEKTPADFVPDELKGDETQYDLAEGIFGFVDSNQKGKRKEVAGRVFITDGIFKGNPKTAIMDEVTLSDQALSSPKPTTFQHYLTQDNPDDKDLLNHYDDAKTKTTLRGHKFYWHISGDAVQKRLREAPKVRPNTNDAGNRFKPVKADQTFTFNIHFDNLRPEELGALLWVLEKATDKYRLKLGMGKPYGLGSVGITYAAHLTNRVARYGDLFSEKGWNQGPLPDDQCEDKLKSARQAINRFVTGDERLEIDSLPRIKELLKMLSWEKHPPASETEYMSLDEFAGRQDRPNASDKKNPRNLSKRPVLPTPSKVVDFDWFNDLDDKAPEPTPSSPRRDDQKTPPTPITQEPRTIELPKITLSDQDVSHTVSLWEEFQAQQAQEVVWPPQPGTVLEALVDFFEDNGDVYFTFPEFEEEGLVRVRADSLGHKKLKEATTVALKVLEIVEEFGETIVECQLNE